MSVKLCRKIGRPILAGVFRHIEIHDSAPVVNQDDHHEKDAKSNGGNDEEVDAEEVFNVIVSCPSGNERKSVAVPEKEAHRFDHPAVSCQPSAISKKLKTNLFADS